MLRMPSQLLPAVQEFIQSIVPNGAALIVPVLARQDAKVHECFKNVDRQVKEYGGFIRYGWAIREWPFVFVEAEFHAVWLSPDDTLVDVSPGPAYNHEVLFLPDPQRYFDGRQVSNRWMPLRESPIIDEYIQINNRIFDALNEGDLAETFGMIAVPKATRRLFQRKEQLLIELSRLPELGRNEPCACGSRKKYKRCHGS